MAEDQAPRAGRKRRSKRLLTPSEKYEIWLRLLRLEVTMAEAADGRRGGPLDGPADPHGGQGWRAGGVGGVQADVASARSLFARSPSSSNGGRCPSSMAPQTRNKSGIAASTAWSASIRTPRARRAACSCRSRAGSLSVRNLSVTWLAPCRPSGPRWAACSLSRSRRAAFTTPSRTPAPTSGQ